MTELTFDPHDKLNRKVFADRLTKAITTFSPFYDEAYVLSLNATFGSGKTTFLEMWKNDLEGQGYTVVSINAWETDFDDEPIIPIASTLLQHINEYRKENDTLMEKSLEALVGLAEAGDYILQKTAKISVKELDETKLQKQGKEISRTFSVKKKIYSDIEEYLPKYAESLKDGLLIIMVDELDRVRPDYAVKFLEAIKHIFSVKGVCFILAVDRNQLQASVEQLYGKIDFDNYYLRFVTHEAELPEACTEDLSPFIEKMAEDFFDQKKLLFPFQGRDINRHTREICLMFELRPRQIQNLFRRYSQFMALGFDDTKYNKELEGYFIAPLFLMALGIKEGRHQNSNYHKIGKGEDPIHKTMGQLSYNNYIQKYIKEELVFTRGISQLTRNNILEMMLIFGTTISTQNEVTSLLTSLHPELQARDAYDETTDNVKVSIGALIFKGLGHQLQSDSVVQQMYRDIESWRDFLK